MATFAVPRGLMNSVIDTVDSGFMFWRSVSPRVGSEVALGPWLADWVAGILILDRQWNVNTQYFTYRPTPPFGYGVIERGSGAGTQTQISLTLSCYDFEACIKFKQRRLTLSRYLKGKSTYLWDRFHAQYHQLQHRMSTLLIREAPDLHPPCPETRSVRVNPRHSCRL